MISHIFSNFVTKICKRCAFFIIHFQKIWQAIIEGVGYKRMGWVTLRALRFAFELNFCVNGIIIERHMFNILYTLVEKDVITGRINLARNQLVSYDNDAARADLESHENTASRALSRCKYRSGFDCCGKVVGRKTWGNA